MSTERTTQPIETSAETSLVLAHVETERNMQRERYGDYDQHSPEEWDALIREYLWKASEAETNETRRVRLVQVAALAVAAAEAAGSYRRLKR